MLQKTALIGITILFFLPFSAYGHQSGFASLTTTNEEGYEIDLGYEETTFRAQEPTRLLFELYDNTSTSTLSSFTEVWVVIEEPEGDTVFSGGIDRPEFGDTSISYVFPREGKYEVQLRFQEESEILAKGNFTLTVPPAEDTGTGTTARILSGVAIGLLIGYMSAIVIGRRRRTQPEL